VPSHGGHRGGCDAAFDTLAKKKPTHACRFEPMSFEAANMDMGINELHCSYTGDAEGALRDCFQSSTIRRFK